KLIYTFTFLPVDTIVELVAAHREAPHLRLLQKKLAEEITVMVHSLEDLEFAQKATEILFGKATTETLASLNEQQLLDIMEGVPRVDFNKDTLGETFDIIQFLSDTGIFSSKGEARKMLQSGGLSINKQKVTDA